MRMNTPPRDDEYEHDDDDIGEVEEVYEINDDDDLGFLDEDDDNQEEIQELDVDDGDEIKTNPIVFSRHNGSVFCCALSAQDNIAASGGEDDKAFVWDTTSGSVLFECTGHKDSVTSVAFSQWGDYLASGDMMGLIQVWKISTKTKSFDFETDDLNWLLWHPFSNILFAGTSAGQIWMWLIPKGNTKSLSHVGVSTDCGSLTRDGKRLCAGYANGVVKVYDLKSSQAIHSFECHTQPVTSISTHRDNILIMSGSTDGSSKILNSVSGKEISTLVCSISEEPEEESEEPTSRSVECVSFCPSIPNLALTASLSGIITIWDIPSRTSRHHIVQGCGTSSIDWHPVHPYALVSGLDGILRVFDVRSAEQLFKFKGHKLPILSCGINNSGTKIITSSDDGTVRILNTENIWP